MSIKLCQGFRKVLLLLPLVIFRISSVLLLCLGGLSGEVSIPVLPPILENLELVYLRRPG